MTYGRELLTLAESNDAPLASDEVNTAATATVLSALAEINPGDPVWREELSLMRQMLSGKQANTPDTSA